MHRMLLATGTALLLAGCADADDPLGPANPELGRPGSDAEANDGAGAARQVDASGEFLAQIDPTTFTFTPRGRNCLLTVGGRLVFTGTIEGTATGTTRALVFATCDEVMSSPPGAHPDVFRSEAEFEGTIAGEPVTADLLYMGSVGEGGAIDGRLIFSNGAAGRLDADAIVAVGGSYSGMVVVP